MTYHYTKKYDLIGIIQAVSNKRFANTQFSQLNDERCWHGRERSPSKRCDLPISEALCFVWESAKRAVTSGWRALTDVPTSLVIQLRKLPVSKPPVRHSLIIPKQFRFGNSSTKVTDYNSQSNSVRDSVILCSHYLPRPINSRNRSVR